MLLIQYHLICVGIPGIECTSCKYSGEKGKRKQTKASLCLMFEGKPDLDNMM